jgi:hypothetical protein
MRTFPRRSDIHQTTLIRVFTVSLGLHQDFYPLFLVMIIFLRITRLILEILFQVVLRCELSLYERFLTAVSVSKRQEASSSNNPESKLGVISNFPEQSFEKIHPFQSSLVPRVRRKLLCGRSQCHTIRKSPRARLLHHPIPQSYFESFPSGRIMRRDITSTRMSMDGDSSRI